MNLQIYKPNSKNAGCAISFQISQKDGQEPQFYVNMIAQHSWNDQKKTGSFSESRNDPSKNASLKFNEFELGEIINAIQQKTGYFTFHNSESNKTSIKFAPFEKVKGQGDNAVKYTAFGLSITRNGSDSFKIPLEPGECVRLISFINKYYSILDDARKLAKDSAPKSVRQNSTPAPVAQKAKTQQTEPVTDEVEF
jgi:hypothetical protein